LVRVVALGSTVVTTGGRVREFRAAGWGPRGRYDRPSGTAHQPASRRRIRILNVLAMPFPFHSSNDLHKALGGPIGINVHIRVVE
jgi:hypothetical protein